MEQERLYSDWQSAAGRVFWGIVIVAISTIFVNLFDMIAGFAAFIEWAVRFANGNDVDFTETTVFKIGVTAHIINIIGYVLYFIGLTAFAQIQQTSNAARYVYKARTALIVLLITSIVGTVFMFVVEIPFFGLFFAFVIWLLYVIGYFIMKGAYDGLMHCDDFSGIAKLGAKNVRYAAVCMLRLLFAPIVLFFMSLILLLGSGISFANIVSVATSLEQIVQGGMGIFAILLFIGFIVFCFMLAWSICALIWPMMGWYRIKNGGPADIMIVIEEDAPTDGVEEIVEEEPQHEEVELQETVSKQEPVEEPQETLLDIEQDEEKDDKKKWYFIIGGIVAAIWLAVGGWWFFSHHNGNNNPLGVQKPKWEKFVMVNAIDVMLYKEADTSSPNLKVAVKYLDGIVPDEKMTWEGDKMPRGYDANDYPVEINTVFPVLDENDEWYKVYIGTGEIREAYLQKKYSDEVKAEPITKDILAKVNKDVTYKLVEKGEFANLYLERYFDDMEACETVNVGVLTEGCIVVPDACCFLPRKSDSAGVDMRNGSNSTEIKPWELYAPESYWKPSSYDMDGIFDVNLLKNEEIQKIVMAVRPQGETTSTIYYYFPTVASDTFIAFEYSFSPAAAVEVEEGNAAVTDFRVEGEKLIATVDGEDREVDLDFGNIELFGVKDLDGDGNMEAVISHFMSGANGAPVDCPFVVYYDADSDKFKKTDEMKLTYENEPTFEGSDGTITMVQREGLRMVRYAFEGGKLIVKNDEFKNVGKVAGKVSMDELFSDREDGVMSVSVDYLDDEDVTLTFEFESLGNYHGLKMTLKKMEFVNGKVVEMDFAAETFKFLKEKTDGMPDFIGDNYLYRWNGSRYISLGWDGNKFVEDWSL